MKRELPLVALKDTVMFPGALLSVNVTRPKSKAALDLASTTDGLAVFVCQKSPRIEDPGRDDLYSVGTVGKIRRFWRVDGDYNLTIEGVARVVIEEQVASDPFFRVLIGEIKEEGERSEEIEALVRNVNSQLKRFGEVGGALSLEASISIFSAEDPNRLVDAVTSGIDFKAHDKQEVLETVNIRERLIKVSELLAREIRVLEIGQKITSQTQEKIGKVTKETILKEQLKSIEQELGVDEESREIAEFKAKIKNAGMPDEVREKSERELARLAKMSSYNPESGYIRTYLEVLTELPWNKRSEHAVDVISAATILDEDHYGLAKAKERILEYLAVHSLAGKMRGPILCFFGPPGVGKTSIGKSIARALGRKFVRVSLGGIRDEAEIRGHRRTYVGALPGRVIQGIKTAGTKDPVFMLDEIDKVGADFRGDPSAALLEALDPEQNNSFSDHYLEVAFDLSDVMFITTANVLETIPPALRDRLEVIEFPGYTHEEKFQIGKSFLFSKQRTQHGLKDEHVSMTDQAIRDVIHLYTREAGVRNLEREIASVIRKATREIVEKKSTHIRIGAKEVVRYLGPIKYTPFLAEKKDEVGASTGLAWTEAGGEILTIEVTLMPGRGQLTLTGHLGDVMKESCQAALSYVRSRAAELGLPEKFFYKLDIHVHVPAGAVPKDGPSAGAAIATAIASALTKIPVRKDVGMTGEVTLRGKVLEIGGVKEKIIAAHRAGLKTVALPKDNKKDLEEIPKNVQEDLKFVFVKSMDEVLKVALTRMPKDRSSKPISLPQYEPRPAAVA